MLPKCPQKSIHPCSLTVMGVEASILLPKAAAATSDYRAAFAASYRISQKTLAAAHGSPTGSQKATRVRSHTQKFG